MRLQDSWSEERAAVVADRVRRRLEQRERASKALVAVAVAGIAAASWLALRPASAPVVHFGDGSFARGDVTVLVDRAGELRVRVGGRRAEFELVKRPGRKVLVEVPPAVLDVVGTRFAVARDATGAFVVEGAAVYSLVPPPAAPAPPPEVEAPSAVEPAAAAPTPKPAADWRPLATHGDFDRAFPLMKSVRDEPKELLLASDVARLSGHPAQARTYLQQLLQRHGRDPRAPLAAFTLGRVLLDELGWPRDAAEAFAKARALEPNGPLAEDALAREVEAWSRAGEGEKARAAAEAYLEKYPRGQRALGVRRYGGR